MYLFCKSIHIHFLLLPTTSKHFFCTRHSLLYLIPIHSASIHSWLYLFLFSPHILKYPILLHSAWIYSSPEIQYERNMFSYIAILPSLDIHLFQQTTSIIFLSSSAHLNISLFIFSFFVNILYTFPSLINILHTFIYLFQYLLFTVHIYSEVAIVPTPPQTHISSWTYFWDPNLLHYTIYLI